LGSSLEEDAERRREGSVIEEDEGCEYLRDSLSEQRQVSGGRIRDRLERKEIVR
jgi:hypothetical protein